MEGFERYGKKRVMVVVDHTSQSKHAMMWALTHVANKGDFFTLLHIVSHSSHLSQTPSFLANSLGYLCKASRPEVEVEALVIQGQKLETVLSQVKKIEAAVLVVPQKKPSIFDWWIPTSFIILLSSMGPAAQSSLWNSASTMQIAVQLGLENRPMAWAVTLSTPGGRRTSGFLLSPLLDLTDEKSH